jgi:hypothetical protein
MAALTLPSSALMTWPLQLEAWTPAEPQGTEDKKLREVAGAALRHWQERSEYLLAAERVGEDYNSVPLRTAFTVRVKYRQVGALKPLRYPLDE